MANENYIEELKLDIVDSRIEAQRERAKRDLEADLKALADEFEQRRFDILDKYINRIRDLNHYENDIQMGDFFYLSDLTCALSQMISSAEGEKYLSHKTDVMDKNGNVVKTIVSFVKEDCIDGIDDKIGYMYSLDPESVKEANPNYVYLTEYDGSKLGNIRDYLHGDLNIHGTEVMVTFNPYNSYLDDRHVLGRMYDPHFDYVNNFMNTATQSKMLHGFEKTDDFAQMAIVHGVGIYKKNHPGVKKGRIRLFSNKK